MSTKHTHTHRGHCQACLRVQAIDMQTGQVAKHGYLVPNGYFVGTCPGSGEKSLHVSRFLTDFYIATARERGRQQAEHVVELTARRRFPDKAWSGRWVPVEKKTPGGHTYKSREQEYIDFVDAPLEHREDAVRKEIALFEQLAKNSNDYADDMTKWAAKIHDAGVPAYRVEELEPTKWAVGDTLRIGGKKGFDAKIEAIEERDYRTVGYRRGSQTVKTPHALVTYPAVTEKRTKGEYSYVTREARPERKVWEALRNYKRGLSELAQRLKEAGKL